MRVSRGSEEDFPDIGCWLASLWPGLPPPGSHWTHSSPFPVGAAPAQLWVPRQQGDESASENLSVVSTLAVLSGVTPACPQ